MASHGRGRRWVAALAGLLAAGSWALAASPAGAFVPDAWYTHGLLGAPETQPFVLTWQPSPAPSTSPSTSPGSLAAPAPSQAPADLSAAAQDVFRWTNATRMAHGLPPLADDPLLDRVALAKCQDMVAEGYFGDTSPRYGTALQLQQAFGVSAPVMGGENLAGARTVALAYFLLVSSPPHLANILYPAYTAVGTAVVPVGVYGVYVCQEFIGR